MTVTCVSDAPEHGYSLTCFNPRCPCGQRRIAERFGDERCFNPRCPCGQRLSDADLLAASTAFQSTLPVWAATGGTRDATVEKFQSTLPVWAATRLHGIAPRFQFQSTLPVWAATERRSQLRVGVSIHAARVGSDRELRLQRNAMFQSTLPVWAATLPRSTTIDRLAFQSTLPVWAATRSCTAQAAAHSVSIHAARVGSDPVT